MFKRIMMPVDLTHLETQTRALDCARDLAKTYGATVTYVGVTSPTPSSAAHSPEEFAEKLRAFAREQGKKNGIKTEFHSMIAHDPTTELDDALLKAVSETLADVVVMASHDPGLVDYIWPSNGGKIAAHAHTSVFLVR
ncbi:MAG: universal stress protein [Sulfitobacter sp.]|nr:universal stress protein [Sulfitobacter sp.]